RTQSQRHAPGSTGQKQYHHDGRRTTMSTHLDIQLTTGEGALLRTLGLIQRRGFRIEALSLQPASEQPLLRVSVDGHERCPRTLTLQIERLHDVRSIKAVEPG